MLVWWCGGVVARSQMYEMLQSAGIRHYQSGLMHLVAGSSGTHNVIYTNVFDFPKTFKVAHGFYYNLSSSPLSSKDSMLSLNVKHSF